MRRGLPCDLERGIGGDERQDDRSAVERRIERAGKRDAGCLGGGPQAGATFGTCFDVEGAGPPAGAGCEGLGGLAETEEGKL